MTARRQTNMYLKTSGLKLSYPLPDGKALAILNIDNFGIDKGMTVGLMGPSGSGKTSFLYCISGIERPQEGEVWWGDVVINKLSPIVMDRWRQKNIGFIFQDFHLIPRLTPLDNVLLPAYFRYSTPSPQIKEHARGLLKRIGLEGCNVNVEKLSRGEKQRVAIARALIMSPPILLADEPTGSLDHSTADAVIELLMDICRENGTTLIMASHDYAVMSRLSQVYFLYEGKMFMKGDRDV